MRLLSMKFVRRVALGAALALALGLPLAWSHSAGARQQQPPPPASADADQDRERDRGDRERGDRPEPPPGRRPGGPGGPGPRMGEGPFEKMRGYLDLVDRFSRLARDPAASGVAAVIAAGDVLRTRGADAAFTYYNKQLETVKNDTVKRAIRLQLVDLYRQSGQQDKALEHLTDLMNSVPADAGTGSR